MNLLDPGEEVFLLWLRQQDWKGELPHLAPYLPSWLVMTGIPLFNDGDFTC